ncbi:MAG: FHA domain-containing protein [Microthrixaceae bacterium]|nr:FHA domain-containing protein [Microthrixaceae bacterium]MCO5319089.1 FHA domain-containing protein [Microthrixaceae bacterium]
MPEQLLTILKICLLVLLYLFFLRVIRAVWAEVAAPRLAPDGAPAPVVAPVAKGRSRSSRSTRRNSTPTRLRVVEPTARSGADYEIGPEVTIGRSAGCSIVLDEQYVSSVHTRLFTREDQVFVEDLGSTNGTWINGVRAVGQMPVRTGDRVQIGNVILELC